MEDARLKTAIRIVNKLRRHGFEAFFAGGYVRDMILGLPQRGDIDIATSATPSEVTSIFQKAIGVGEHFGVIIVVVNQIPFEIATFRSDTGIKDGRHPQSVTFSDPCTDAQRRDFTINGLFYDPVKDEVIDYVEGIADIEKKVIRTIGDPHLRFKEDYLRVMRAIRFASRFDFVIEPETWDQIKQNAPYITKISMERIFQELTKMLTNPHADRAAILLEESGLLQFVLPEIQALRGVEQPKEFHPEGDVLSHTIKALSFLENPTETTAWSVLLHDIGKQSTQSYTDRIRFNNHPRVGAEMAHNILKRLKSSRILMKNVYECVDNHMNFMNVKNMRLSTLKKFLSRPTIDDELELHRVDCLASHGNLENYHFLQLKRNELHEPQLLRPTPLLTGKDLIELGFKPGPIFGIILNKAYDLQLEEKISTNEEARQWVKSHREEFFQ